MSTHVVAAVKGDDGCGGDDACGGDDGWNQAHDPPDSTDINVWCGVLSLRCCGNAT